MPEELIYGPFIKRSQAKSQGLKHYFTGKPCKKGHITFRHTASGTCSDCVREAQRTSSARAYQRAYAAANSEKIVARVTAWKQANPERHRECRKQWEEENSERISETKRKHYEANREKIIARSKARVEANPEEVKKYRRAYQIKNRARLSRKSREWKQANPERARKLNSESLKRNPEAKRAVVLRRRATKRQRTRPDQPVTKQVIAERLALTDGCCYCGRNGPLQVDHVVALNDGGWHVPGNILGACKSCNSSKCDHPVEQWFRAQPFFSEDRWQKIQELTQ